MVNALIHADYLASGGVRIFRLSNGFEFHNPGLLRLPAEQIRAGGKSDCRNPSLQQMFQMIGAGEKAGSGFPKIVQAWREQHWRAPALEEDIEQEEVCLRLPTISLFPPEVTEEMEQRFPGRLARLDETGRLAIATAILEGRVTNERLQELTDNHPRDITFLLKRLVDEHFLVGNDKRRWSSYTLAPAGSDAGLMDSHQNGQSTQHKPSSSQHKEPNSQHKEPSSQHKEPSLPHTKALPPLVEEVRTRKRSAPAKVEAAILALCADAFVPAQELADTLQRGVETLKNHYISKMIRDGRLEARYPEQPTHPLQAYRAKVGDGP
jgi:ATP-dependent DNA helicase RecG